MSNNTENRKNNFIVIYDFFSKKLSDEYKASFKKLYPKGVTHGKWAEDSVGDLQHAFKLGLETIVVFLFLLFSKIIGKC